VRPEGLGKLIKIIYLIGSRTRDLPVNYMFNLCRGNLFNYSVRFEVITALSIKNAVSRDVTSCGSCLNRRFGESVS
jgi:hypothetical protein